MIDWPQSLVTELAERRCVIVLGAGASRASVNQEGQRPPNWKGFLLRALELAPEGDDRDAARELIRDNELLDAAQVIWDLVEPGDWAKFIHDVFEAPRFEASSIHSLVADLDPKVVVTTNYDRIYERLATAGPASAGYNVCKYYESHLVNDLRSDKRVIAKVHGCVTNPHRLVLTRRQYFAAQRDAPNFYATLNALFLTNTLLFIGSGFSGDPDVDLLLQNTTIAATSAHTHYAVVEGGRHASVVRAMTETYNVKFLEYEQGQHEQVSEALAVLKGQVDSHRAASASG